MTNSYILGALRNQGSFLFGGIMEDKYKIIEFDKFCGSCKHRDDPENDDICEECLCEPARYETHIPLNYEK